jgi:predicted PurR-regulated permease PerM
MIQDPETAEAVDDAGKQDALPAELIAAEPARLLIEVPWSTVAKVFASLIITWMVLKLAPFILLIFLAVLIAITLLPVVDWLEARKMHRRVGHILISVTLLGLVALAVGLLVPAILTQLDALGDYLPALRREILDRFPSDGALRQNIDRAFGADWSRVRFTPEHLAFVGAAGLSGLSQFLLVLVVAVYLMIDGRTLFGWVLAFFKPATQAKLRCTASEISQVTFAYVWGQVITSALVMGFSFVTLTTLKVPGAVMIAVLAGFLDVFPILGFILSVVPACLLALSVSPATAITVLLLYILFHALENYLIVPYVYGKRLRLSTLTVLLSLLAGGILAGIPGALAILPLVASYPAVERIWLKPFLHSGVTEKHERQKREEFGPAA